MKSITYPGNLPPVILNGSIKNQALANFACFARDQVHASLVLEFQTEFAWKPRDIRATSPVSIPKDRNKQAQALLWQYPYDDLVWFSVSGQDPAAAVGRWLSVANLRELSDVADGRVQVSTIPQVSGGNAPDIVRRFLLIKTRRLDTEDGGGLFLWLHEMFGLEILAVVETDQGVYEGWFTPPGEEELLGLSEWLTFAEVCDADSFDPFQKAVLPGKSARLLYLAN